MKWKTDRGSGKEKELYLRDKYNQPERTNPEDTIYEEKAEWGSKGHFGLLNSICDVPNSENK